MSTVDASQVRNAVKKRRDHVIENQEVLTMKQFRKLLEQDLDVDSGSLKSHKALIEELVDQMVSANKARGAEGKAQTDGASKAKSKGGGKGKGKESSSGKKSKRAEEVEEAPRKKHKQEKVEAGKKAASGPREDSKAVKKAKNICKQAGIKIPPNIYRNKDESDLQDAFSALLEKHDLTMHSSSSDIAAAARRLQKEKDLEGIDSSNIVEGGRRSRPQVNYHAVLKPKYLEAIESDSDAESDEAEESSDEQSASEASDEENVKPKNGKGEIRKGKKSKVKKAANAPPSDESEGEGSEGDDGGSALEEAEGEASGSEEAESEGKGTVQGEESSDPADGGEEGEPEEADSARESEQADGSDDDNPPPPGQAKPAKKGSAAKETERSGSAKKRGRVARDPTPSGSADEGDASDEQEEQKPRRVMAEWSDDE